MMKSRNGESGDHFDLLPFINILMCTLGTLLLVTLSLASLSLGTAGETWEIGIENAEGPEKQPILIEWDGAALVVHGDLGKETIAWSPDDKAAKSESFETLLEDLAGRKDESYALFAVRPSGFGSFESLKREFKGHGVEIGYEPIGQLRTITAVKSGIRQ